MKRWHRIAQFIVITLLLVISVNGLWSGIEDLTDAATAGQYATCAFILLYSIAGVVAIYGIWKARSWTLTCIAVWTICSFGAAFGGSRYFGDQPLGISFVSGSGVLIFAIPFYFLTYKILKAQTSQTATSTSSDRP